MQFDSFNTKLENERELFTTQERRRDRREVEASFSLRPLYRKRSSEIRAKLAGTQICLRAHTRRNCIAVSLRVSAAVSPARVADEACATKKGAEEARRGGFVLLAVLATKAGKERRARVAAPRDWG